MERAPVTATGAIWGFLTLLAIFEQNWRMTIFWMVIAMFVDGFDGMLARCLQHETDHLDGLLYLDRLEKDERRAAMRAVRESDWF